MHAFQVIKHPVVSEKTQMLELSRTHTVIVDPGATKVDVRSAFERLYDVKVESVNIISVREKFRASGKRGPIAKRRSAKKAIVKLGAGSKLVDFQKLKLK